MGKYVEMKLVYVTELILVVSKVVEMVFEMVAVMDAGLVGLLDF